MTTADRNGRWSRAYYAQARSDFGVHQELERGNLPRCHALQHLQMATEKIAKAYRLAWDSRMNVDDAFDHDVVVPFVRTFLRQPRVVKRLPIHQHGLIP